MSEAGRPSADYRRILVIKLGALGDFVQASRAMAEIRRARPRAKITLLATPPYAELGRQSALLAPGASPGRPRKRWPAQASPGRPSRWSRWV